MDSLTLVIGIWRGKTEVQNTVNLVLNLDILQNTHAEYEN